MKEFRQLMEQSEKQKDAQYIKEREMRNMLLCPINERNIYENIAAEIKANKNSCFLSWHQIFVDDVFLSFFQKLYKMWKKYDTPNPYLIDEDAVLLETLNQIGFFKKMEIIGFKYEIAASQQGVILRW